MLGWVLTFMAFALAAALLGFTQVAGAAADVAQVLFLIFLVLIVITGLARAVGGKSV